LNRLGNIAYCQSSLLRSTFGIEVNRVTALYAPEGWQARAACRGQSAAIFFAPTHFERKEARAARERKAKAVCATCPVRKECLSYALRIREPHGIWGGLSEVERRAITG
jgi:WhiB family transcriptional regulator, redox-sensing transcriptional regulator